MNNHSSSKLKISYEEIVLFMEFIREEFEHDPDEVSSRDMTRISSILPLMPLIFQRKISSMIIEDYKNDPDLYTKNEGRSLLNKARLIAYRPSFNQEMNRVLYWYYVDFDEFCKRELGSTYKKELGKHSNIFESTLTSQRIPVKFVENTWIMHVDDVDEIDKYLLQTHKDFHEVV